MRIKALTAGIASICIAWFVSDQTLAQSEATDYLRPQRGVTQANETIDGYYLILRDVLLRESEFNDVANAIWTSSIVGAHALQITRDPVTQTYTVIGAKESTSLWHSYSYWRHSDDPVVQKFSSAGTNAPPRPADVEIETCSTEIPATLARRVYWLWDTALLNARYTAAPQMLRDTTMQFLLSTVDRSGEMWDPGVDTANGSIALSIYALNDLCWLGRNGRRLDEANARLDQLRNRLEERRFTKGASWAQVHRTEYESQMTVFEIMLSENDTQP